MGQTEAIAHELAHHIVTRVSLRGKDGTLGKRLNGDNRDWADWQEIYALAVEIEGLHQLGVPVDLHVLAAFACSSCRSRRFKNKPVNVAEAVRPLIGSPMWTWHVRRFVRTVRNA